MVALVLGSAPVSLAQLASNVIILHSFAAAAPKGSRPQSGLFRDSSGNLYGTASSGGPGNAGVVYKVDTTGQATVVYSFRGGVDGGNPSSGVIRDAAGNLYGATGSGGASGAGVVYRVNAAGHQVILHSFTGGLHGSGPHFLILNGGYVYGTTAYGGVGQAGVVYKVNASGQLTVLHSFGKGEDGKVPLGITRDSAGNLYGTTSSGGTHHGGVIYQVDTAGIEKVLYNFEGHSYLQPGLVRDSAGNFYGAMAYGGSGGAGTVYKVDGSGTLTILYNFTGMADGGNPNGDLTRGANGVIYGTCTGGGLGSGLVYKIDSIGQETVLHTFTGTDGRLPQAGVILDPQGNVYGTTYYGGVADLGALFEVDGSGEESVLYSFEQSLDGINPSTRMVRDMAGNIYGTTTNGGSADLGVVYKVDANGTEAVLQSFGGVYGGLPFGGVIRDSAGNLFGTTYVGGPDNCGLVYKIDRAGATTVLTNFVVGHPCGPVGDLARDSSGNLYGITRSGSGQVYKLDTAGQVTTLYSFMGGDDGMTPLAGVFLDGGFLYGTTYEGGRNNLGTVYKVDASGKEAVLYTFKGGEDGGNPQGRVIRDAAGNLYGTTTFGGSTCARPGCGVVYKLDPTGQLTVLYRFTGGADGANPLDGVVLDPAGNLYGTTVNGGTSKMGVVFKIDPTGHETVLYSFIGGPDGQNPYAGVILDAAGNLYGNTYLGGINGTGVIFELEGAARY